MPITLTQAERDWLAALWRQAERDAEVEWQAQWDAAIKMLPPFDPTWPTRPPLSW